MNNKKISGRKEKGMPCLIQNLFRTDIHYSDQQKSLVKKVDECMEKEARPNLTEWCEKRVFPKSLVKKLGEEGLLGITIPTEYGGRGLGKVEEGIVAERLEAADSAIRTIYTVQSNLYSTPILIAGTEEQKRRFLPDVLNGESLVSCAMTEPHAGSDISQIKTFFEEKGDYILLNGEKKWITHAPVAERFLVWAKKKGAKRSGIQPIVVNANSEGVSRETIEDKDSLRVSSTGNLRFNNVKVPRENLINAYLSREGTASLDAARYTIACGSMGAATDCLQSVYDYYVENPRVFHGGGHPFSKQLFAARFSDLVGRVGIHRSANYLFGKSMDKKPDSCWAPEISIVKSQCTELFEEVANESKRLLGAEGLRVRNKITRHHGNASAVRTYDGTTDIHRLRAGRYILGVKSF